MLDINDLRTLSVSEVYSHSIPLPFKQSGKGPRLSGRPSKLDQGTRDRIENNFRVSLTKQMIRLLPLDNEEGGAHRIVHDLLCLKKSNLKLTSQALAKHLWSVQPGNTSAGMLLVAKATCNGSDAVALMKVDNELRVRHSETQEEDELTFDLSEIETLSMDANKVFKAALFVVTMSEDGQSGLAIIASDHQAHGADGREAAEFFLKEFLGCAQIDHPATLLRRVADVIMDHISTDVEDQNEVLNMASGILARLEDNNPTFNLDEVLSDLASDEQREQIESKLSKIGVTATEFEKDTSQLDDAKYLSCTLSNGMRLIGLKDKIFDMIEAEETTDGLQRLLIQGTIVDYKLRKRLG